MEEIQQVETRIENVRQWLASSLHGLPSKEAQAEAVQVLGDCVGRLRRILEADYIARKREDQ